MYNVIEFISSRSPQANKHLVAGSLVPGGLRMNDPRSKYYVPKKWYNEKHYPPYVSGAGFVMSSLVAKKIFLVMQTMPHIPVDDAYLGICLRKIKVKPIRHDGFHSWGIRRIKAKNVTSPLQICFLQNVMTIHQMFKEALLEAWRVLQQSRNQIDLFETNCSSKFQLNDGKLIRIN